MYSLQMQRKGKVEESTEAFVKYTEMSVEYSPSKQKT